MRKPSIQHQKWILAAFSLLLCVLWRTAAAEEAWSKPESTVSSQDNNGWIPVQGKCLTCRPNRDLDAQTTNEQINKVLSPPAPLSPSSNPPYGSAAPPYGSAAPPYGSAAPPFGSAASLQQQGPSLPPQQHHQHQQQHQQHQIPSLPQQQQQPHHQIQSTPYKQPRILPFGGPNFHQFNLPFGHEHKFQIQPTKLFPQEGQKQFYQFEGNHFQKQPFNLPQQQLIQTPQQRFPFQEPYPFTLPLKTIEATTPKISYNPKIRFPDNDGPPSKPVNKIPPQNVDEIQLLYVPVETLQRNRHVKNMKDLINQQAQQYQPIPQNFAPPTFNVQYQSSAFPKLENNLFFPPSYAPPSNFLQLNALPAQKLPDNVFQNISKNLLQPYFTINGLYSPLPPPQIAPLPTKQSDLQFYNILQPALINPPQVQLKPEPSVVPPPPPPPTPSQINRQPNKYDFNNNVQMQNLQGGFILSNGNSINDIKTQPTSQSFESYPATTPEILKTTEYITGKPTVPQGDFSYNYITGSPQPSATQNQYVSQQQTAQSQQYYNQQNLIPRNVTKSTFTPPSPAPVPASGPYDESEYPVPHQPPLSFYMEKLHNTKINDVLYLLKDSKTIPVLDTVESEPPQVFVGPSELQSPKGYVKFELPYLSSLDYNRIERMIDRLPFFVAPLNFKPPPGYSKIPFPAPHIGSVVLSNSTVLQESLNKYDQQKYKPPQSFSASPELSTITPQLTSQINSLIDSPPPSVASEILKNYEESTKKPIYKNTYRPASPSTEAPKRNFNRQRKPIFRGYPTTETPTTYETSSTTETPKEVAQNNNDYVEFAAKGKFNFGAEPSQNPTYQPNQVAESYQSPPSSDNTYQPQTADTYQSAQVSSTYQPTQQSQFDTNYTTYTSYQNNAVDQTQNENLFTKKIASQVDYNGNQNYPFYNFDLSSSQAPSEPPTQNATQEAQNYNFNNVKPLSQYNHFLKKEDVSPVNITEPAITSTSDASYQFWNQNQFYKNNPNTLDYFSSTVSNNIAEPIPSTTTTTEPTTSSRYIKPTTEPAARPVEPTFTSDQQKIESQSTVETTPTTTTAPPNHRLRNKQRVPNRYQSKYTTEKHIEEEDLSPKPTYDKVQVQELDSVQQSTENNEASTRVEIKRRRRPTRPAQIITAVTESSSSTSRSFRTRATRYPTSAASSTERYRPRRPTTNAATEEYTSNYAPSAPASNEIVHEKKLDLEKDHKPEVDNYWNEAVSIHQSQSYEVTPSKASKNFTEEGPTDYLPWTDVAPKNSGNDGSFYQYTTSDSRVSENPENKTQGPTTVESSLNENPTSDQVSPTFGTVNYSTPDEHGHGQQEEKQEQDIKSDKFLAKDDSQKKAYNPQDEKKVSGRRRGTWVKKIRIKRPQDVFETAESQNLGRITDNSVQLLDSKIVPKTDEGKGSIDESHVTFAKIKSTSSSVDDSYITTTEPSPVDIVTVKPTTTEKDDYLSLQRNFDQMLSDFLNSNDQSVKSVNIERNNTSSAENNIGYVLGLDSSNQDTATNSSSSYISISNNNNNINNNNAVNPTEIADEVTTTTTYPNSGEFSDFQGTTTEDNLETFFPNKLIGTSTTTEISLETEICYRGKCVKTKKSKASDLLPVE